MMTGGIAGVYPLVLLRLKAAALKKAFSGLLRQARWSTSRFWDILVYWKRRNMEWDWMWCQFCLFLIWKPGLGVGETPLLLQIVIGCLPGKLCKGVQ